MYHVVSGISLQSHRYFLEMSLQSCLSIYMCVHFCSTSPSGVLCLLHVSHFLPLRHLVTDREGVASPFPKLFSWDFQNCRWLCSCMKFVWFCWDFQICSWIVVWSLYLFVNALSFPICVLKLFSICVLKPFRISSAETSDGLFCFSSSILLLQYWPKQRVPNWCYSGITDNKQRHHNLLKFARNLFPQSWWRKLTQISRKTAENYVMLMKMAAN